MIVLRVIGSVISFLFLVEQVSMSTIDLVEVNPDKDVKGITVKNAAKILSELLQ